MYTKGKNIGICRIKVYGVTVLISLTIALLISTIVYADGWRQESNEQWQYFENNKPLKNQWIQRKDGTWNFVNGSGFLVTANFANYENERYYVDENGTRLENQWFSTTSVPKEPHIKPLTTWYYAGEEGKIYRNGWHEIGGYQYYFNSAGVAARNSIATIEEKKYYIDENTGLQHNGWFNVAGLDAKGNTNLTWYYANSDGTLLYDGWYQLDGITYYFYPEANSPRKTWMNQEDRRYYFDEEGKLQQSGWFYVSGVNGNGQEYTNWYFAEADGNLARGGFKEMDQEMYFFDSNGLSYRKRWYIDEAKNRYYFDEDGKLQHNGWFMISNTYATAGVITESWHYATETGSVLTDGVKEINGEAFYFDVNGTMYKKRWVIGKNGKRQYFQENGIIPRNEWFAISGTDSNGGDYTNWYYADSNGYILRQGWHEIDGRHYYMNSSGIMRTGWFTSSDDKEPYYCESDGTRVSGWQYLKIPEGWYDDNEYIAEYVSDYGDSAWFYFDPGTGRKTVSKSKTYTQKNIDGITYCIDTKGIMQQGWVHLKTTSPAIKGYSYYSPVEADGLVFGQKVTEQCMKVTGPKDAEGQIEENWYYFDSEGVPVCGTNSILRFRIINGKKYAFDKYGQCRYGFLEMDGYVYYFGTEENRAGVTGKCMINDGSTNGTTQYYFDDKGRGASGVKNGHFYYKGRLQKADPVSRYEVFEVETDVLRLVDSSGKVIKGKSVKDGSGTKWLTSSDGTIIQYGNSSIADTIEPDVEDWKQD